MAVVQTRDLTKVFKEGQLGAVNHVNLETREGEFLVFLGPSGSGKTTLLRMIAGLETPTSGEILIGGQVVNNLSPRDRRIAMVFQSYALYPHLSVYKNIAFPLKAQEVKKELQKEKVESHGSQCLRYRAGPSPGFGTQRNHFRANVVYDYSVDHADPTTTAAEIARGRVRKFDVSRVREQLRRQGTVFRDPAFEALAALRAHKLRSALTLLGVTLSVSVLILVVSIITGANLYIQNRVANLGSNVCLVVRFPIITNQQDFLKAMRRNKNITWEDYQALHDGMKLPKAVGLETRTNGKVRLGTQALDDINIRGVTANIADMDVEEPETGRYITDADNEGRAPVTFIGQDVASKLFPTVDPIGKTIYVDGMGFQVVGVAKPIGTVFGQSQDNFVYLPIRTFLKRYGEHGQGLDLAINIQARGPEWMKETEDEARTMMRARHHLDPKADDNFGVLASDTIMGLWKNLTGAVATTMVGVVSVFLVIGGVVIMNVMLASVTERTREIGVRKSLGARRRDIMMQFLVECAVMSAVGGATGIAIAYLLSTLVRVFTPVPSQVPIGAVMLSLAVSTIVGLFFGLYPANRASKLDPIEALRFEI